MQSVLNEGITKLYDKLETWLEVLIKMLPNLAIALVIIAAFWILSGVIYNWTNKLFKKTHMHESLEHLMANTVKILVICLGFVFALSVLELQKTVFSLLAGVGVIGLALGFAFQDLAANFISGIMLAIRAPFKLGDVVEINGIQGTIQEIHLRDTHIRNFDGQDIIIPNKDFTENELTNYSSFGRRKIKVSVGIGYDDDSEKGIDVVQKAVESIDGLLNDPKPSVYVDELGASSVNLTAHFWFKYPGGDYLQLKNDATIKIKKSLDDAGFNIPYPTRTLDIPKSALAAFESSSDTEQQKSIQ